MSEYAQSSGIWVESITSLMTSRPRDPAALRSSFQTFCQGPESCGGTVRLERTARIRVAPASATMWRRAVWSLSPPTLHGPGPSQQLLAVADTDVLILITVPSA